MSPPALKHVLYGWKGPIIEPNTLLFHRTDPSGAITIHSLGWQGPEGSSRPAPLQMQHVLFLNHPRKMFIQTGVPKPMEMPVIFMKNVSYDYTPLSRRFQWFNSSYPHAPMWDRPVRVFFIVRVENLGNRNTALLSWTPGPYPQDHPI